MCQYCKYGAPENVERVESYRGSRRLLHTTSFKEFVGFVDKKEAEVKSMKRKPSDKQDGFSQSSKRERKMSFGQLHAGQSSDRQPSSLA